MSAAEPQKSAQHSEQLESSHSDDLPPSWGYAGPGVVRCPYPCPEQYPVIKQLGIKTVVNLLDQFPDSYKVYLSDLDVRYVHIPVKGNKQSPEDMSRTAANQVLKLLMEPALQPVLVHCRSGKHRTGAIVGCLRRVQGHPVQAATEEYRRYATPKQRQVDEMFIQRFDVGLYAAQ